MPEIEGKALSVAIVCPEYRTEFGGEGGVTAVVEFVKSVAEKHGWLYQIYSPRMSRQATESRQALRPRTWRRLRLHHRSDGVVTVGSHVSELEPIRYLPRRVLDRALNGHDLVVVVAGSPAAATVTRRLSKPVVLQVATLVRVERRRAISEARGLEALRLKVVTGLVDWMDRRALRSVEHVLVENHWMYDECVRTGAQAVTLAPPGIDTSAYVPTAEYAADGPIVMVARLGDARKDFPTLFRSYARARELGVTAPLILAGRGQLANNEIAILDELALGSSVEVRRDLSHDELVALLQSASLFVTSSSEEGLGISIVEAMACGLPVVSTATEGARFVIGDSTAGALVPIGDVEALATSLASWMGGVDRRRAASQEARIRAVQLFSQEATSGEFDRVVRLTAEAGRG